VPPPSLIADAIRAQRSAVWRRKNQGADVGGLFHHSERGVRYRANRYTQRLAEAGDVASVGSKGDSYDNAMTRGVRLAVPRVLDRRDQLENLIGSCSSVS
jgi:transposase InsO family protein